MLVMWVHTQCLVDILVAVEGTLVVVVDNLVAVVDNLVAVVDSLYSHKVEVLDPLLKRTGLKIDNFSFLLQVRHTSTDQCPNIYCVEQGFHIPLVSGVRLCS